MGADDTAGERYTVRALVYVEERGGDGSPPWLTATGYRATITCRAGAVEDAVILPLADAARRWPVQQGGRVWHCVEAFIAALPSFRARAAMDHLDGGRESA